LKVALLSHEGGGISSVTYGLAHSLSKKRVHTTVFTGSSEKPKVEHVNAYLEIIRLPFLGVPPRSVWFQLRNFRLLWKLPKDYTVLHGVSPYISVVYTLFKRKLKKPFIASIHGTPRGALRAFIHSPISCWTYSDFASNVLELPLNDLTIRKCMANSNHVVVSSFAALNELRAYNNLNMNKVSVIYNGIDFDEIESIEIDHEKMDGRCDFSIIYAGRLLWMKGVMFVLKAFEILNRDFKSLELKIFGKGPLEREIKRFIFNAGLRDNVHFGGHLPHKDLIAEVKKSDVVVLPSLYESQPMIALEAMACKKPLVVFDLPYARELIVNEYNGLLAEVYNTKDLSDKIGLLLSDEKLRFKLGQNGYKYIKREHNWNILSEKYLEVYQNVAGTR